MIKIDPKLHNIQIFRLSLALSKHWLKMPVLANTLFGPEFSFSQHFDFLNNVTVAYTVCCTVHDTVLDDLFQMVVCF